MRRRRNITPVSKLPKAAPRSLQAEAKEEAAIEPSMRQHNIEKAIQLIELEGRDAELAIEKMVDGSYQIGVNGTSYGHHFFRAYIRCVSRQEAELWMRAVQQAQQKRTENEARQVFVGFDPASPDGDQSATTISFMEADGRIRTIVVEPDAASALRRDGTLDPEAVTIRSSGVLTGIAGGAGFGGAGGSGSVTVSGSGGIANVSNPMVLVRIIRTGMWQGQYRTAGTEHRVTESQAALMIASNVAVLVG